MSSTTSTRITRAGWALARLATFRPTLRRQQATAIQSSAHSTLRIKSTVTKFFSSLLEKVLHHRSTGSGRPCDCSKCLEAAWRPYCGLCRENPTAHQELTRIRDGTGASEYTFTNWCEGCWKFRLKRREEEREEQERQGEQQKRQKRAFHVRKEELNKMLEQIRRLPPGERVPLSYAVQKYIDAVRSVNESIYTPFESAETSFRQSLSRTLREELRIAKRGKRYFCDKRRADAMDFKMWHYRSRQGCTSSQSTEGDREKSSDGSYLWDWVRSVWSGNQV